MSDGACVATLEVCKREGRALLGAARAGEARARSFGLPHEQKAQRVFMIVGARMSADSVTRSR